MRASKMGGLGWASAWLSLGLLVGCQLLSSSDDDDAPPQNTAGSSSEGGQGGSTGVLPRPGPTLLASGGDHTCVRDQGVARCWGDNYYGQLGTTANSGISNPNPVPALVDKAVLTGVLQPALGLSHSCALRDDGRVLCWGANDSGQLGTGAISAAVGPDDPHPVPALFDHPDLGVVRQLALGGGHSCALRDDGRVLCWGANYYGQLGSSAAIGTVAPNPLPTLVDNTALGVVKQLALGVYHSCALRDDGRVLCWGDNYYGQLGTTANSGTQAPTPVPALVDNTALGVVKQVAVGAFHSCALRDDGRVLCWGNNVSGQLGIGANSGAITPNPVPALVDDAALGVVKQLALGRGHSCALRDDGRVLCWGDNVSGQLGSSDANGITVPNPVPALVDDAALGVVKQLALGRGHSCALREDGRVLCWGDNGSGQLGIGANSGTIAPTPVPTLVEELPPLVP